MAISVANSAQVDVDAYAFIALDSSAKTVHQSDEQKTDEDGSLLWLVTIKRIDRFTDRKDFLEVTVSGKTAPPDSGDVLLPGLSMRYSAPKPGGGWSGIYWRADACTPAPRAATQVAGATA